VPLGKYSIIDVQERRVAACFPQLCVLVPEVRPMRHSKDTRISRIRRLLATPSTSYLHNPPLCHTNTRTHLRARTPYLLLYLGGLSSLCKRGCGRTRKRLRRLDAGGTRTQRMKSAIHAPCGTISMIILVCPLEILNVRVQLPM
jgi:hypothetical protein